MNKDVIKYLVADLISVSCAWLVFNVLRYHLLAYIEFSNLADYLLYGRILWGQFLTTFFTLSIFYYSGYYNQMAHKSRLSELALTFYSSLIASIFLFFIIVINDLPHDYSVYYTLLCAIFLLIFFFTYIPRLSITQAITHDVHHRRKGFNTLVIGTGDKAAKLISEIDNMRLSLGYNILGCVSAEKSRQKVDDEMILGQFDEISQIIKDQNVEELIVALDTKDNEVFLNLVYQLFKHNLPIKTVPGKFDILAGNVRMDTIYATPLVDVSRNNMHEWEKNIKESLDFVLSFVFARAPNFFVFHKDLCSRPTLRRRARSGQMSITCPRALAPWSRHSPTTC
jgi:FlaA1/EpsC-like NDP-sugar epimerase